jgi:hypothetical protein
VFECGSLLNGVSYVQLLNGSLLQHGFRYIATTYDGD